MNFLPESALNSLFFASLSLTSISNFRYEVNSKFQIELKDIMQDYELLINLILNRGDYQKELRSFLLETEYFGKGAVLSPNSWYRLKDLCKRQNIIGIISNILINSLALGCGKHELIKLRERIDDYSRLSEQYKNTANIGIYLDSYREAMRLAAPRSEGQSNGDSGQPIEV